MFGECSKTKIIVQSTRQLADFEMTAAKTGTWSVTAHKFAASTQR